MIDAYMLVDFNNPLSLQYMNLSLESFSAVNDIVKITPVQCTTPETLPIRFQENEEPIPPYVDRNDPNDFLRARYFGGSFCDSPLYQSIMYSQLQLIKRIANGEPIAIMEHDAALVNEDSFREMVDMFWGQVDVFIPGACMEFYGLSKRVARWMIHILDNFPLGQTPLDRLSGPYGILNRSSTLGWNEPTSWLVPTKSNADIDKTCFSTSSILKAQHAMGHLFDPACKQFMFNTLENTNTMTYDPETSNHSHDLDYDGTSGYLWKRDFVFVDKPEEI